MNRSIVLASTVSLSMLVAGLGACCGPVLVIPSSLNHCGQPQDEDLQMAECCLTQMAELQSYEGLLIASDAIDFIDLAKTHSRNSLPSKGSIKEFRKTLHDRPSLIHQTCVLLI